MSEFTCGKCGSDIHRTFQCDDVQRELAPGSPQSLRDTIATLRAALAQREEVIVGLKRCMRDAVEQVSREGVGDE